MAVSNRRLEGMVSNVTLKIHKRLGSEKRKKKNVKTLASVRSVADPVPICRKIYVQTTERQGRLVVVESVDRRGRNNLKRLTRREGLRVV